jgi:hypothetical protein
MFGLDRDDEYNALERLREAHINANVTTAAFNETYEKAKAENAKLEKLKAEILELKNAPELHFYRAEFGWVFWDKHTRIIKVIHENDADFRREYFEPLFHFFGINVIQHGQQPVFLSDELLISLGVA